MKQPKAVVDVLRNHLNKVREDIAKHRVTGGAPHYGLPLKHLLDEENRLVEMLEKAR